MNILCIDFNYIFSPFIRLYADRVSDKENPSVSWRILENDFGLESIVSYDSNLLLKIVKLIKDSMSAENCKLIVVDEQSEIVKHIEGLEDARLTNIDFFDDMDFSRSGKANLTRFGKYDNRNWLAYLILNGKVSSVEWVKSPNSVIFKDMSKSYIGIDNSIDDLRSENEDRHFLYNRIYISRSPLYVPYKYQHLIDMIVECFKEE